MEINNSIWCEPLSVLLIDARVRMGKLKRICENFQWLISLCLLWNFDNFRLTMAGFRSSFAHAHIQVPIVVHSICWALPFVRHKRHNIHRYACSIKSNCSDYPERFSTHCLRLSEIEISDQFAQIPFAVEYIDNESKIVIIHVMPAKQMATQWKLIRKTNCASPNGNYFVVCVRLRSLCTSARITHMTCIAITRTQCRWWYAMAVVSVHHTFDSSHRALAPRYISAKPDGLTEWSGCEQANEQLFSQ